MATSPKTKTKSARKSARAVQTTRKKAMRTYDSALKYLFSQTDYEQMRHVRYNQDTFNLNRMRALLKKLGDPHTKIRTVHIAGTKGKGSTATMLAQMLSACEYSVGLYTSPHIVDIRERISINGAPISRTTLTELICKFEPIIEKMPDKPTFFEIFTAMAFLYFAKEKVDLAVIETGLGGRLDSTNVLKPDVCGITSISLDHMAQLGRTLTEIATEKAGIMKRNTTAVSVPQPPEAEHALKKYARAANVPLKFAGEDIDFSYRVESSRDAGCQTRVCLTTPRSRFEHLTVPLLGEHQAINCGLALALLDELKARGMKIDDEQAIRGLQEVYVPGRMEMVSESPRILVDGAHNGASISALMRAIGQHIPYDSMIMIFGCGTDKDITGMLEQVATGADKVIFTKVRDNVRAATPEDLAERYEACTGRTVQVSQSLAGAMQIANNAASREDLICITGSFYLVGEAKRLLKKTNR